MNHTILTNLATAKPSNNTLSNVTSPNAEEMESSTAQKVISSIAMSALILLSVSGNALVIASFYQYKRIRRSVTNCFIVSLAVSDLMVAFLSEPFWLSYEITQWRHIPEHWDINALVSFWLVLDIVCAVSSIANLMFISIDRYFAIKSPLSHHTKMTTYTSKWIILGLWGYASGTGCIVLLHWPWRFLLIFIIGFLVPLIIMVFCYAGILVVVSSKARLSNRVGRRLDKEFKTAKSLGVVTGSFVICWLPFFIVSLSHKYCISCRVAIESVPAATSAVKWLHYLNSCLNPIIYAFLNPTFKVAFRNLFRKICNSTQGTIRDHSFSLSFRQTTTKHATKITSMRRSSNKGEKEVKENGNLLNGNTPAKNTKANPGRKLRFKTPLEESFDDSSSTEKRNEKLRQGRLGSTEPLIEDLLAPCIPPRPGNGHLQIPEHDDEDVPTLPPRPRDLGNSTNTKQLNADQPYSLPSIIKRSPDKDDHDYAQNIPRNRDSILSDSNNNPGDCSTERLIPKSRGGYTSLDSLARGAGSPEMRYSRSMDLGCALSDKDATKAKLYASLETGIDTQFTTLLDKESNMCYLLVDGKLLSDNDIKTSNV
ncbi:D(1)-like dopamine receptor isoform X2 [Nematostella vectensis]|nr:D(1)-like dopamine receptor isoform X2 [Nematostella vectensis]XP_032233238.1 D(1)-like dopamine receptor isoform X2 [Nematostella vectensis]XP_032233239.1 D(1)-like dopamine receptor isoform X2 [Nematostella vectensis]XP_032233240.1 D(1)-like dopamine receptor isoform X2 [Nematostella vectensis]XP_032233241.1 D(1)-like dopamine receptor isoform X2 [Nematostella vectensis]XP_032233242.1 D(1)-like dopamine receptor isoform X2 [Nematostella vectensis]XP_048585242.1 D(1)-like dopamine recepto